MMFSQEQMWKYSSYHLLQTAELGFYPAPLRWMKSSPVFTKTRPIHRERERDSKTIIFCLSDPQVAKKHQSLLLFNTYVIKCLISVPVEQDLLHWIWWQSSSQEFHRVWKRPMRTDLQEVLGKWWEKKAYDFRCTKPDIRSCFSTVLELLIPIAVIPSFMTEISLKYPV